MTLEPKYFELLKQDDHLHAEADAMLKTTGLGKILAEAGYHPVGSYSMRAMTWRDLDFEREADEPSWSDHWDFGRKLAETGLIFELLCQDSYQDPRYSGGEGLYWGIQLAYPTGGSVWKMDLWTARREEFESGAPKRPLWASRLTDETRGYILEIKQAIHNHPDYRKSLLSVHIYEAVLEEGIRGVDGFWGWWRRRYSHPAR